MNRAVGIEAMHFYGGSACLDVTELAKYRNLNMQRFENLLMEKKTVAMPFEDPISFGVNAAKPLVDALTPEERDRIELLVTCTESGIDFGKSLSTYIHDLLGLNRNCRLFEVKNACFSGTAGFQTAVNFIQSGVSPGAKALVVATDMIKFAAETGGAELTEDWAFAEPSGGAGAIAMLVSEKPYIFRVDPGANGSYGYEIMDTCRPTPNGEAGNADISLLSYLDCAEAAYKEYAKRVKDVDYQKTFDYLVFHTPFGGMVKGSHRSLMRKICRAAPKAIEQDFETRVMPGIRYCRQVGNLCGGTVFLNMMSTIAHGDYTTPKRLGVFSYGSGCCSEFYSGVVTNEGHQRVCSRHIQDDLDARYHLSIPEYEQILTYNQKLQFGVRDLEVSHLLDGVYERLQGRNILILKSIRDFHREYEWS